MNVLDYDEHKQLRHAYMYVPETMQRFGLCLLFYQVTEIGLIPGLPYWDNHTTLAVPVKQA